jgi:hypothetical protein
MRQDEVLILALELGKGISYGTPILRFKSPLFWGGRLAQIDKMVGVSRPDFEPPLVRNGHVASSRSRIAGECRKIQPRTRLDEASHTLLNQIIDGVRILNADSDDSSD